MRNWKRGPALLLLAAVLSLCALSGCGRAGQGLEFSACVGGEPEELDPIYATSAADQTILVHLYDNLMRKIPGASGGSSLSNGAAQDVQEEENADFLVDNNMAVRLNRDTAADTIKNLLKNKKKLKFMKHSCETFDKSESLKNILNLIVSLIGK